MKIFPLFYTLISLPFLTRTVFSWSETDFRPRQTSENMSYHSESKPYTNHKENLRPCNNCPENPITWSNFSLGIFQKEQLQYIQTLTRTSRF